MEYNGGFAYVAPSAVTPELDKMVYDQGFQKQLKLNQQALAQQKQADLEKQRELDRNSKATKFIGDQLDPAKYDTLELNSNHLVEGRLSDMKTEFAKKIHDNPNMDEAELEGQMQDRIGKLNQYSKSVKTMKLGLDAAAQAYEKNEPGVDVEKLKLGAMKRFLYTKDGSGKDVLNENPDLNQNYMDEELKEHPELYVKGDVPIMKAIEQYKPKNDQSNNINEHAGTTIEDKFKGQLFPWNHIEKDAKGNVTGIGVNSGTAQLNGQNVPVVDDETYQRLMNNGVAANLKRDTDKYISDNNLQVQPGSEQYKIIGKNILYKKLKDLSPTGQDIEHKKTNATFVDKAQAGLLNIAGKQLTVSQKNKEDKITGGAYGKLIDAFNGDSKILDAGIPWTDPDSGKKFIDVTDPIGEFNTNADFKARATQGDAADFNKVSKILIDPSQPGKIFTIEHETPSGRYDPAKDQGHLQEYDASDLEKIMTRHASKNGMGDINDLKTLFKLKPIKQPTIAEKREAAARAELEKRKQIGTTLPIIGQ